MGDSGRTFAQTIAALGATIVRPSRRESEALVVADLVNSIAYSPIYIVLLAFLGIWPLLSAIYWIAGAFVFFATREAASPSFYLIEEFPLVSVLVAAHNEEAVIANTLESLMRLNWPNLEIVVMDDASGDDTPQILAAYAAEGKIRVITKFFNEGKAMGLNDAIPLLNGEFILLVDADGSPQPDALRWMIPHFLRIPRCGAVTANPRVTNTTTILAKLQVIEFSATVSVLRRAQACWGRIMSISGVSTCVRKSAVERVGRFRPEMATEDIALTWQLQNDHYEVRYEPRAVFAMEVPETLGAWWKQRKRWALGLGQVMRRNAGLIAHWSERRMWPLYIEAVLSTIWAHLFVLFTIFWAATWWVGYSDQFGANPLMNFWGLLIATVSFVQIALGLALDSRYDRRVRRYLLWAPLYPLIYWALLSAAATRSMLGGLIRKPTGVVVWTQARFADPRTTASRVRNTGSVAGYVAGESPKPGSGSVIRPDPSGLGNAPHANGSAASPAGQGRETPRLV